MHLEQVAADRAAAKLVAETARRRTFAIISHPDAGKTTLTEKLLLYGGAIHLAGAVKARRAARHATSDWMALERERGISVTTSVLQFDYEGQRLTLLDTPGHEDFSEDTYRTLVAADSAVMLLDNRKGVEERTRQLFAVCHRRRMPIFTFVNKCDRPGADPLALLGDVEGDLGVTCAALNWPIRRDGRLIGVHDRRSGRVTLFQRAGDHGATKVAATIQGAADRRLRDLLGQAEHRRLEEELALLDGAGHPFSQEAFLAGDLTPVFFGSALTNFGVEPFLHTFVRLAPPPAPREATTGPVEPTREDFTAFVFKIQANMDPRHRDRVAFLRVCSGHFEAGMEVVHQRSGRRIRLAAPQQFLARDRSAVTEAWPGEVIGVIDKGTLRIGDSLSQAGGVEFAGIPRFPPEHFARVVPRDSLRRRQLDTGLRHLTEEGAAQVFYAEEGAGPAPILGAVGLLQFDVMRFRLEHEYGAPCRLEPLPVGFPRWVVGPEQDIARAARAPGRKRLFDAHRNSLLVFKDQWTMRQSIEHPGALSFSENPPVETNR